MAPPAEYSTLPIAVEVDELVHPGLQVDPHPNARQYDGLEVNYGGQEGAAKPDLQSMYNLRPPSAEPSEKKSTGFWRQRRIRRRYIVIGAVVVIIIIVAAVVGGVLGSKGSKASSGNDTSNNKPASPTSSTSPQASSTGTGPASPSSTSSDASLIASKSSIAAVGWKSDDGSADTIFVAFHDAKGTLVYSSSEDATSFSRPQPLSPEYEIKKASSLAMSALAQSDGTEYAVQLELFYLNESSTVNGLNYNSGKAGRASGFGHDSLNEQRIASIDGGNLASYWPLILFQDINANLQFIFFDGAHPWRAVDLSIQAKDQTQLAMVPITRNASRVTNDGWMGLFYQVDQGRLSLRANPLDTKKDGADELADLMNLWSLDAFPKIILPDQASFAAFSVARPGSNDSTDKVDTYVLYQDSSSDIKQVWLDNDKRGWQTSNPEALKGADKGTGIACITTPTWSSIANLAERLLSSASDLTKCFFQKSGELVQVNFSKGDWSDPKPVLKS